MNKHDPNYPDFSPVTVDTFTLLEGHAMRDCWFESEEIFVVPPNNETHVIVSHHANGQYYTSIKDYGYEGTLAIRRAGFVHREGSARSHHSWKEAFEYAKVMWEREISRLETKAPSPGLSSEAAKGAPAVSQPQAESASAPAPHHSGAPPQGADERAIMILEARIQGYEEDVVRLSSQLATMKENVGANHPLVAKRRCLYCNKMTRITTAACDHCDVEDK